MTIYNPDHEKEKRPVLNKELEMKIDMERTFNKSHREKLEKKINKRTNKKIAALCVGSAAITMTISLLLELRRNR